MSFVAINGIKLYYEIHGDGDPIVLLHHGFGCTKMWNNIYPALVDHGYRVIMYDRRGYGNSEAGRDFKAFYVSDKFRPESVRELELLVTYLGINSFHVIGQCEGGVVAVDYAATYHERVKSVITSSTQCYSHTPMAAFNESKFPHVFQDLEPDLKEKLILWHGAERAEPFYNQFRRFGGAYGREFFDLRPMLSRVACPALVLYPDRSFLFDVEQGVAFYRHLTAGELAVLPKCGHNTYEHQPREYVHQVLAFLERHGF
ncbi:MAG: alpha/beta hydrolase [Deltaproteobacteria bacterium]|nr:alpha/beta hydrolase [Deltaproteobacteria bacterium]